jgi:hypothetical protein
VSAIHKLTPVEDPGDAALPSEIPQEVLRFAALDADQRRLLLHVHGLLETIPYGTVVLVMQDGKVIQIETSEKIRLR